jgi:hypothetical protein
LLAITEEWPNFSSSVLLCLLDHAAKQAEAAKAAAAAQAEAARALETAWENLAVAKAKLAEEQQKGIAAAAAAAQSTAERLAAVDAEKAVLAAEVSDLQDQVCSINAVGVVGFLMRIHIMWWRLCHSRRQALCAAMRLAAVGEEKAVLAAEVSAQQDQVCLLANGVIAAKV